MNEVYDWAKESSVENVQNDGFTGIRLLDAHPRVCFGVLLVVVVATFVWQPARRVDILIMSGFALAFAAAYRIYRRR